MKKKLLALVMAVVLVAGLLPVTALAEEGELPKLSAPTELQWGKDYYWQKNDDGQWVQGIEDDPDYVLWKTNAPMRCDATVEFFHKGEGETKFTKVELDHGWSSGSASRPGSVWVYDNMYARPYLFATSDGTKPAAGTYKFTVQLHKEGYQDSDVVESPEWTYVDPGKALPAPSNVTWGDKRVTWTMNDSVIQNLNYSLEFYYSATKANATTTDGLKRVGTDYAWCGPDDGFCYSWAEDEEEPWWLDGDGYYYVRICTQSDDFTAISNSEWSELSPAYHYVSDRPPLPTPTDLTWNMAWYLGLDGELVYHEEQGTVAWKCELPEELTWSEYKLTLRGPFQGNTMPEDAPCVREGIYDSMNEYMPYFRHYGFLDDVVLESGNYAFTVQYLTEGTEWRYDYKNSEVAVSPVFHYEKPQRQLTAPGKPIMKGTGCTFSWSDNKNEGYVQKYLIEFYFSKDKANATSVEELEQIYWTSEWGKDNKAGRLYWWEVKAHGAGYYYCRVRALSKDMEACANSDWSPLSKGEYIEKVDPLPAPTDLTWNMAWWKDENGNRVEHPDGGSVAWKCEVPEGHIPEYEVALWGPFEGDTPPEDVACVTSGWFESDPEDAPYFWTMGLKEYAFPESGNYVFSVRNTSRDGYGEESEVVYSEVYHYEKPQRQLAAPGKPKMSGTACIGFAWEDKGNWGYADGHYIEFYFSPNDAHATSVDGLELIETNITANSFYTLGGFSHYTLINTGTGYYYCRARTLSTDIEECANSDWSPLSDAEYIEAKPMELTKDMFTVDTSAETYTGKPITKEITSGAWLEGICTVTYQNNTNVGTATIIITGDGTYYTGTLEYTFTIKAKSTSGSGSGSGSGSRPSSPSKPAEPAKPVEPEKPVTPASEIYRDVVKGSWYEDGVTYVTHKGLFQGMDKGVFAPDFNMTRAMVVTVLARLDGENTENVAPGAPWYTRAMNWAKKQGISDGTMPNNSVIREQLVTMLYRYAKSPATEGNLNGYVDRGSVSDWAKDAMVWAVSNGILTGKDGQRLDPKGTATRAEVAAVIQRFVEKLEK